jgi:hypothetical protein
MQDRLVELQFQAVREDPSPDLGLQRALPHATIHCRFDRGDGIGLGVEPAHDRPEPFAAAQTRSIVAALRRVGRSSTAVRYWLPKGG